MMARQWITTPSYQGECRRITNGSSKLVWTTMLGACGIVFIGFMAWMTSMNVKLGALEASATTQAVAVAERVSTLETVVKTVDVRLTRIEQKLDQLIERKLRK